jgi:hypothetical protein
MKNSLFLLLSLLITFYSFSSIVHASDWITGNITDEETQLVDDCDEEKLEELVDCMREQKSNDLSRTTCVNEVLGDE